MIGTINIKVNAAHPNMPLAPLYAFIGSPSQVRVIDVPKQIGNWKITAVQITANYPDNSAPSVECVLDGGCWHGTLPASTAVGQSLVGFKVTASGVKEDGTTAVTGYVLGAGDVFILNADSTITVGSTTYYVHLVDSVPATPKKGDLAVIDGVWKIYTGSAWSALGSSTTVAWGDITGKPSTFPPEAHTHTKTDITDFPESMTPTEHASSHATGGSDPITPADIGAGTYSKPSGGIPKADLASAVQTSLDKADTAIQSHQDISGKLDKTSGTASNLTVIETLTIKNQNEDHSATITLGNDDNVMYIGEGSSDVLLANCGYTATEIGAKLDRVDAKFDSDQIAEAWSQSTTYAQGANVTYNGKFYKSLQNGNTNHEPDEEGSVYWDVSSLFSGDNRSNNLNNIRVSADDATTAATLIGQKAAMTDLPYGYVSTNVWSGTATDGATNRMPNVTANVQITAPTPTSGKTGEFILRFTVSASSAPTVTVNPPTGGSWATPLYAISGDTIGTTGEYEMMVQMIPTATANQYEYVACTRKISA